ncbi:MAG: cyanophycin synthetase, partial [Armatimonadota bacterium]
VGLGGRLDATNIITPTSCAIVSIGLDHVSILGSTLKEIAHEKAGIIKPGKPVVVGQMAEEALTEIERIAAENESQIWRVGREIQWERIRTGVNISTPYSTIQVAPNLFGEIQLHNAAVAYASLEVAGVNRDLEGIRRGFSTATIPGRFERLDYKSKKFILDGAHNADSAAVLAKMLQESKANPKICITGMLTGHTASEFYDQLKEFDLEYYVVPIDFHRSMDPTVLADDLVRLGSKAKVFETLQAAVEAACKDSDADDILVCGSFYLVGETKRQILSQ